ncbi:hypothetical protein JCM10212_006479 [Sporobolomyces blumeae]
MAESVLYRGTPLDDYLQGVHATESSDAVRTLRPKPPTPIPSSNATERVKYALATSAFLASNLADALQLYPSPTSLRPRLETRASNTIAWPERWDTVGLAWYERPLEDNLFASWTLLVAVYNFVRVALGSTSTTSTRPSAADAIVGRRESDGEGERGQRLVARVDSFVRESQGLDWAIDGLMERLGRETSIDHAPVGGPPETPPMTPPQDAFHLTSPSLESSPLAATVSESLSSLSSLLELSTSELSSLLDGTSPLGSTDPHSGSSTVRPSPNSTMRTRSRHVPTASLAELQRHMSRAISERREVQEWEEATSSPKGPTLVVLDRSASRTAQRLDEAMDSPSRTRSAPQDATSTTRIVAVEDPFHPTTTFFGGLERKSSTRSTSSLRSTQTRTPTTPSSHLQHQRFPSTSSTTSQSLLEGSDGLGSAAGGGARRPNHRVRPSVGSVGIFGIGTAQSSSTTPRSGTGTGATLGGIGGSPLLRELSAGGIGQAKRRRPASMGGWVDGRSAQMYRDVSSDARGGGTRPSREIEVGTPTKRSTRAEASRIDASTRYGQVEALDVMNDLKEQWQASHLDRQRFVWTLISVLEQLDSRSDRTNGKAGAETVDGVLRTLVNGVKDISTTIERAKPSLPPGPRLVESIKSTGSSVPVLALSSLRAKAPHQSARGSASNFNLVDQERRDFAPPSSTLSPRLEGLRRYRTLHQTLLDRLDAMRDEFDSISEQLEVKIDEAPGTEPETDKAIADLVLRHDQIQSSLEDLAKTWVESRLSLRTSLGLDSTSASTRNKTRPKANDDDPSRAVTGLGIERDGPPGVPDELDPTDAPPEEDGFASLDDGRPRESDDDGTGVDERQAVVDALEFNLGRRTLADSTNEGDRSTSVQEQEKVFEGVVEDPRRALRGPHLSREERILRMKEGREALDAGRLAARGTTGSDGGGLEAQQRMVGELREVLRGMGKGKE